MGISLENWLVLSQLGQRKSSFSDTLENRLTLAALYQRRYHMNQVRSAICMVLVFVSLFWLGCAVRGPVFTGFDNIPSDKGCVYIYTSTNLGILGYHEPIIVFLDGKPFAKLGSGGFCGAILPPGKHIFEASTEVHRRIGFSIEAGKCIYVKMTKVSGIHGYRPWFQKIYFTVGEREIVKCKRACIERD